MENKTFEAVDILTGTFSTALGLIVFTALLLGYLYSIRNKPENKRLRQIGAMLVFYVLLMAIGTAIFSYWNNRKLIDIVFEEKSFTSPYGVVKYNYIKNAKIQTETTSSYANANIVRSKVNLLVIEETNGKAHILSDENYEIREIMGELRKRIPKKEE